MFVGGSDERHFRVIELDKKKVEIGGVSIKPGSSPGSAARKLLTSIAHQKGLKKNKKTTMSKVKFCIQEYTQGSSKKVYGPYVGHFHKYTAAELKKASTAGGKIKFTMKPVVKLFKIKNNQKGGLFGMNSCTKEGRVNSEKYAKCELRKGLNGVTGKYKPLNNRAMKHIQKALDTKQLNENDTIKARIQKVNKYLLEKHDRTITLKYDESKILYFEIGLQSILNLDLKDVLEILTNQKHMTFGQGQLNTKTRFRNIAQGAISYQFSGINRHSTYELELLDINDNGYKLVVGIKKRNKNNTEYLKFEDLQKK